MLLTIFNLPYTVTYNDLKSLAYSKCGISDCILDNLTPHENRTKMVTIGFSGEEDAAIFMRKINGTMMTGHKLQVVPKNKNPTSSNMNQGPSQPGPSGLQSFGQQGSSWAPQLNLRPPPAEMLNQGAPTMVPPPGPMEPYGGANSVYYPNQHAYYMMNQPTYSTPSSGPNIGYQTLTFDIMGNQGYSQNSWSNNNWYQQQQSGGPESKKDQAGKWDNGGSRWDNSGSRWDNSGSRWDNSGSSSRWDNSSSTWGNNESNWDNNDNNDSKWGNNPEPERDNNRQSRWDNNRESRWDNNRESRWDNNNSNWDDNRGQRSQNSNDSRWQSNRVTSRDSYIPNQSAGPSRDQDESYRRSDQNNSPRSSQNGNRNRKTYSSRDKYNQGDNEPQQNRYRSERQRSPLNRDRFESPPQNRPRNTKPGFVHGGPAGKRIPTENQVKLARMWRGKFVFTKANQILSDPIFEYNAPDPTKLLKALQINIRKRLSAILTDDYPMRIEQLEKEYSKVYGYKSNWETLRDSLQKIGGQMISRMETEPVTMQPLFKKNKKNKKKGPKIPQTPQAPQQFGRFGNLKVDHRFGNSSAGPSHANRRLWPENIRGNTQNIPLAMIPGRIPQYPWGDKMLYKRQKREQSEMMAGDLDGKMFAPMNPVIKKAIEDEVESLCAKMLEVCDNPSGDPKIGMFCDSLKARVPSELKRALRLNLARRMLPVLPIKVRVHASPMIKRVPLEEFLKDYNVSALLKSVKQPYYVADVNTIAEHDLLCTMDPVKIGSSTVLFKPFHMFETMKSKQVVERRAQKAKELAEIGSKGEPSGAQPKKSQSKGKQPKGGQPKGGQTKNEVGNNKDDDDQVVVDENACYDIVNDENLCKKMKNIYLRINENKQRIELEKDNDVHYENEQVIEEVYLSGKQFTANQVFTDDVDVDYVLDSPKGGTRHKRVDTYNENESDKLRAETIEMADVHADDLVDW